MRGALFLCVFFVSTILANFCVKQGVLILGPLSLTFDSLIQAAKSPFVLAGMACYAVAAAAWILSLSIVPLNVAMSVSAFLYVGIVFIAAVFFGEAIPLLRWAGIGLMMLGMFVVAHTL
jgi:drug/metabolite transporter (DMT)-like permease